MTHRPKKTQPQQKQFRTQCGGNMQEDDIDEDLEDEDEHHATSDIDEESKDEEGTLDFDFEQQEGNKIMVTNVSLGEELFDPAQRIMRPSEIVRAPTYTSNQMLSGEWVAPRSEGITYDKMILNLRREFGERERQRLLESYEGKRQHRAAIRGNKRELRLFKDVSNTLLKVCYSHRLCLMRSWYPFPGVSHLWRGIRLRSEGPSRRTKRPGRDSARNRRKTARRGGRSGASTGTSRDRWLPMISWSPSMRRTRTCPL